MNNDSNHRSSKGRDHSVRLFYKYELSSSLCSVYLLITWAAKTSEARLWPCSSWCVMIIWALAFLFCLQLSSFSSSASYFLSWLYFLFLNHFFRRGNNICIPCGTYKNKWVIIQDLFSFSFLSSVSRSFTHSFIHHIFIKYPPWTYNSLFQCRECRR